MPRSRSRSRALLLVRATGAPVPVESDPRKRITGEPAQVPDTTYFRRRIERGELELVKSEGGEA